MQVSSSNAALLLGTLCLVLILPTDAVVRAQRRPRLPFPSSSMTTQSSEVHPLFVTANKQSHDQPTEELAPLPSPSDQSLIVTVNEPRHGTTTEDVTVNEPRQDTTTEDVTVNEPRQDTITEEVAPFSSLPSEQYLFENANEPSHAASHDPPTEQTTALLRNRRAKKVKCSKCPAGQYLAHPDRTYQRPACNKACKACSSVKNWPVQRYSKGGSGGQGACKKQPKCPHDKYYSGSVTKKRTCPSCPSGQMPKHYLDSWNSHRSPTCVAYNCEMDGSGYVTVESWSGQLQCGCPSGFTKLKWNDGYYCESNYCPAHVGNGAFKCTFWSGCGCGAYGQGYLKFSAKSTAGPTCYMCKTCGAAGYTEGPCDCIKGSSHPNREAAWWSDNLYKCIPKGQCKSLAEYEESGQTSCTPNAHECDCVPKDGQTTLEFKMQLKTNSEDKQQCKVCAEFGIKGELEAATHEGGHVRLSGWACEIELKKPIDVKVYLGKRREDGGTFVAPDKYMADSPSKTSVAELCSSMDVRTQCRDPHAVPHNFEIWLNRSSSGKVYVYGNSATNGYPDRAISGSGIEITIPPVDWRSEGVLRGANDQGMCGAGWAFAATHTLQDRMNVQNFLQKQENTSTSLNIIPDLSVQHMLTCCGGVRADFDSTTASVSSPSMNNATYSTTTQTVATPSSRGAATTTSSSATTTTTTALELPACTEPDSALCDGVQYEQCGDGNAIVRAACPAKCKICAPVTTLTATSTTTNTLTTTTSWTTSTTTATATTTTTTTEQQYFPCQSHDNPCDGGGWVSAAVGFGMHTRFPADELQPYTAGSFLNAATLSTTCATTTQNYTIKPAASCAASSDWNDCGRKAGTQVVDELEEALQFGPVAVSFMVYNTFLSDVGRLTASDARKSKKYIYKCSEDWEKPKYIHSSLFSQVKDHHAYEQLGSHAVELVGHGVQDGIPYWILKNSWGSRWGDDGYFYMHKGANECDLETRITSYPHTVFEIAKNETDFSNSRNTTNLIPLKSGKVCFDERQFQSTTTTPTPTTTKSASSATYSSSTRTSTTSTTTTTTTTTTSLTTKTRTTITTTSTLTAITRCKIDATSGKCKCIFPFVGPNCEERTVLDPCKKKAELNDDTDDNACDNGGVCHQTKSEGSDVWDSAICICPIKDLQCYAGLSCELPMVALCNESSLSCNVRDKLVKGVCSTEPPCVPAFDSSPPWCTPPSVDSKVFSEAEIEAEKARVDAVTSTTLTSTSTTTTTTTTSVTTKTFTTKTATSRTETTTTITLTTTTTATATTTTVTSTTSTTTTTHDWWWYFAPKIQPKCLHQVHRGELVQIVDAIASQIESRSGPACKFKVYEVERMEYIIVHGLRIKVSMVLYEVPVATETPSSANSTSSTSTSASSTSTISTSTSTTSTSTTSSVDGSGGYDDADYDDADYDEGDYSEIDYGKADDGDDDYGESDTTDSVCNSLLRERHTTEAYIRPVPEQAGIDSDAIFIYEPWKHVRLLFDEPDWCSEGQSDEEHLCRATTTTTTTASTTTTTTTTTTATGTTTTSTTSTTTTTIVGDPVRTQYNLGAVSCSDYCRLALNDEAAVGSTCRAAACGPVSTDALLNCLEESASIPSMTPTSGSDSSLPQPVCTLASNTTVNDTVTCTSCTTVDYAEHSQALFVRRNPNSTVTCWCDPPPSYSSDDEQSNPGAADTPVLCTETEPCTIELDTKSWGSTWRKENIMGITAGWDPVNPFYTKECESCLMDANEARCRNGPYVLSGVNLFEFRTYLLKVGFDGSRRETLLDDPLDIKFSIDWLATAGHGKTGPGGFSINSTNGGIPDGNPLQAGYYSASIRASIRSKINSQHISFSEFAVKSFAFRVEGKPPFRVLNHTRSSPECDILKRQERRDAFSSCNESVAFENEQQDYCDHRIINICCYAGSSGFIAPITLTDVENQFGSAVTYALEGNPPGFMIDSSTGRVGVTPRDDVLRTDEQNKSFVVEVIASDEAGSKALVESFQVTVSKRPPVPYKRDSGPIVGGSLGSIILVLVCTVVAYRYHAYKLKMAVHDFKTTMSNMLSEGQLDEDQAGDQYVPREIKRSSVTLVKELGKGAFGAVWNGLLNENGMPERSVAVKTVLDAEKTPEGAEDLLQEAVVMAQVGMHRNVVAMIGVVTSGEPLLLVLELCTRGSLLDVLREWLLKDEPLSVAVKLQWCVDIADGMAHLHSNSFIHRDLAARNVLIDQHNVGKVADFGLSRGGHTSDGGNDPEEEQYYKSENCRFPIRWSAPESFETHRFTFSSDVWSFGIVMYECYRNGAKPYRGMKNKEVIREVPAGYKLKRPKGASKEVYRIMQRCWDMIPTNRPSFQALASLLKPQADLPPVANAASESEDDVEGPDAGGSGGPIYEPDDGYEVPVAGEEDSGPVYEPDDSDGSEAPVTGYEVEEGNASSGTQRFVAETSFSTALNPAYDLARPSEAVATVASAMRTFDEEPIARGFSDDPFAAIAARAFPVVTNINHVLTSKNVAKDLHQRRSLVTPAARTAVRTTGVIYVGPAGGTDRPLLSLSDSFDGPQSRQTSDV